MRKDRLISEVLGQENALTPSDLMNADLRTVIIGGYDKVDVNELLERAANALEHFVAENRRLGAQFDGLTDQVKQHQEMELALRTAVISAQKAGETIVEAARAQARALLEEAQLEKARARHQAEELPEALRAEMRRLQDQRDRLRADIEAVLRAHEALLQRLPRAAGLQQTALPREQRSHYIGFEDDNSDAPPDRPMTRVSDASQNKSEPWETGNEDGEEQE